MPADLPQFSMKWMRDRAGRLFFGNEPYFEEIVRRESVRILHAHFGYDAVWALRLKERTGLPMVTTFHGVDLYEPETLSQFAADYARLFVRGERFIVLGEKMRETARRLGCPAEKLRVIHLSVNLDEWPLAERAPLNGRIRLLFCARLIDIKGLRYILDAMKILADQNVPATLRVIGYLGPVDVPEMDHQAYVRELGIADRVDFLGYQPQEVFREELRRAHVFLQPSVTTESGQIEGSHPTTLVEAQATGCPVIATFHADIPEAVRDGETGLLVEEKKPGEIAEKVRWFLEHEAALREFGRNARRHVELNYNAEVENGKLEALYDDLLAG
jgi:colanic acid/amylovoran biosynthesis glycosyltransferase